MPDGRGIIVVVDDDEDWVEAISDFLLEEGYSVVGAPNGLVALEALSRMQPFAVVTDIQMPIMDGRELLLRVHAQHAPVPVIVVTAEHVQDHDPSLEGAFRVIRKPVHVEELLSALAAAKAHPAADLPLQKPWRAARPAARTPGKGVARPRWDKLCHLGSSICAWASAMRVVTLTIALASSFAVLRHWRGKLC